MTTKSIPLNLKALRAEAMKPAKIDNDPNVFTVAEYAAENGLSRPSAFRDLQRLADEGVVEPAIKLVVRRGSRQPHKTPAWRRAT